MGRALVVSFLLAAPLAQAQECNYRSPGYYPDRFAQQGDGTVLDRATGLVWYACDLGQNWENGACSGYPRTFTWQEALQAVDRFNQEQRESGRDDDWRLPNIKELASLINYHCTPAVFDALWDPDGGSSLKYWSATPELRRLAYDASGQPINQAWRVDFYQGRPQPTSIDQRLAVRPVRGDGS